MYISDTYHIFYLSTTKPSGLDHLLHLVLADLSIIQESWHQLAYQLCKTLSVGWPINYVSIG